MLQFKLSIAVLCVALHLTSAFGEAQERVSWTRTDIKNLAHSHIETLDFEAMVNTLREFRESRVRESSGMLAYELYAEKFSSRWHQNWGPYIEMVIYFGDEYHANNPGVSEVHEILASMRMKYGWAHRGTKWASEVGEGAWIEFQKNVKIARDLLESVPETDRSEYWYLKRLSVFNSMDGYSPEAVTLTRQAIARYPDMTDIFVRHLSPQLLPRWGGSDELWTSLPPEMLASLNDNDRDVALARIAWANLYAYRANIFEHIDVSSVLNGFEHICETYPDALNFDIAAVFHCMGGDKEKAAYYLSKNDENVAAFNWKYTGKAREEWILWANTQ